VIKEEKEKLIGKGIKRVIIIMIIFGVCGIGFIFGSRLLDNQLVWLTQQLSLQQVSDDSTAYLNMKNQLAVFSMIRNISWMIGVVGSSILIVLGSVTIYKTRKAIKEGEKE